MDFQSRKKKLNSVLSQLSEEELNRFARIYAMTNETFALALIEEFWQPAKGNFREMVEMCFAHPSCIGKYGSHALDWEKVVADLHKVLDKADKLIQEGEALDAALIARYVLTLTCGEYKNDQSATEDSYTYYIPEWRKQLNESLQRAEKTIEYCLIDNDRIDVDSQKGLLGEIITDLKEVDKNGLYNVDRVIENWMPYIMTPKKFLRYIDGKLKKAYGLDAEKYALQKMQFLLRNQLEEEVGKCCQQLCRYGKVRNCYADYLIEKKEYRQALNLLDENKDRYSAYCYNWDQKKLDIVRMLKDKQVMMEEYRKHFLTSEYRMKWYKALKGIVDSQEWNSFVKKLLEECTFYMDLDDAEAKIYIREGMKDNLILFFDRHGDSCFEHFKKYGKYLPTADQTKVMQRYTDKIKELSMNLKNRKDYQHLARWIDTLKDVTNAGNKQLIELIEWLRERHCNRPAMMQEIDNVIYADKTANVSLI